MLLCSVGLSCAVLYAVAESARSYISGSRTTKASSSLVWYWLLTGRASEQAKGSQVGAAQSKTSMRLLAR